MSQNQKLETLALRLYKVKKWHKNKYKNLNSLKAIKARHELKKPGSAALSKHADIL